MFAEALQTLLRETEAEFAIFCDYEGEVIGLASNGLDDFDVRLAGAQVAAVTIALQKLVSATGQSDRLGVLCATERGTTLVEALPGHYYVVLSVPRPGLVPFARRRLAAVAELFRAEL